MPSPQSVDGWDLECLILLQRSRHNLLGMDKLSERLQTKIILPLPLTITAFMQGTLLRIRSSHCHHSAGNHLCGRLVLQATLKTDRDHPSSAGSTQQRHGVITETRHNEAGRPAPPGAQEASAKPWQRLQLPALRHPRDPAILSIALPAVLALAADPLLSVVDTLFVGRLGAEELAALGVNTALFSLAFLLFGWLATATTPIIATALARGDKEQVMAWLAACAPGVMFLTWRPLHHVFPPSGRLHTLAEVFNRVGHAPASVELPVRLQAGRTTLQALSMAAVLGTGLAAALHFGADGALELMGAGTSTGELHVLSQQYLQWRAWAAPAVLVTTVGQGTFRWAPQHRGSTGTDREW